MDFLSRIILLLSTGFTPTLLALQCGYPGSPLHGRPDTVQELYSEGQVVTYSCNDGYFLMGPATRLCLTNGTWTGRVPICDTSLNPAGTAEISHAMAPYSATLAIDRKPDTCTYTTANSPRWWRLDMGQSYRVLSVGITMGQNTMDQRFSVYILGFSGNSAIYQRCAAFNGKLASSSLFLVCGEGTGIVGRYVHIEDHRQEHVFFSLCEVDVMVVKDHYDCGLPDRPARSYTMRLKTDQVEYRCVSGYKLMGHKQRQCLVNGQWSHSQPLCIEVNCESLGEIGNGRIKISPQREGRSLLGSTASYNCNDGYLLQGNNSRVCTESARWDGSEPFCKPVDCGEVPHDWYVLLNGSSGFNSMAELACREGYQLIGESPIIRCRGDALWSRARAKCILPVNSSSSMVDASTSVKQSASMPKESDDRRQDESSVSIGLIIGMVGAVIVIVVSLAYVCVRRRRKKADSCSPRDETLSSSGAGSCQSLMNSCNYRDNGTTHPKSSNGIGGDYDYPKNSNRISAPNYSFSVIPLTTQPHSPYSSVSSRENIYEEITVGARRKTLPVDTRHSPGSGDGVVMRNGDLSQPVSDLYAQVDFQKKRESRLNFRDDISPTLDEVNTPQGSPVVLRELPPIPREEESPSPVSSSATVVVENDIYEGTCDVRQELKDSAVVVDNELYSSS